MKKVKVHRSTPSLDMTPMVDLAFLLVTFFMLTTKFTPSETMVVDMPESRSEFKLEDTDVLTITISKEGAIFFNIDGKYHREQLIRMVASKYNIPLSEEEIKTFSLMSGIGVPIAGLKSFLALSPSQRVAKNQPGIPCQEDQNELSEWIALTRITASDQRKFTYAIKGDRDTLYPVIKRVMDTLVKNNIKGFNLVTNLEREPS